MLQLFTIKLHHSYVRGISMKLKLLISFLLWCGQGVYAAQHFCESTHAVLAGVAKMGLVDPTRILDGDTIQFHELGQGELKVKRPSILISYNEGIAGTIKASVILEEPSAITGFDLRQLIIAGQTRASDVNFFEAKHYIEEFQPKESIRAPGKHAEESLAVYEVSRVEDLCNYEKFSEGESIEVAGEKYSVCSDNFDNSATYGIESFLYARNIVLDKREKRKVSGLLGSYFEENSVRKTIRVMVWTSHPKIPLTMVRFIGQEDQRTLEKVDCASMTAPKILLSAIAASAAAFGVFVCGSHILGIQ